MFQERESGKPESWACLIAIIMIATACNLAIIITFRVLLDTEDEINEPIIQGELRDHITFSLGIFTMTFFFGCWCCFCCGCMLCKWILDCPQICGSVITNASLKLISSHPSIRRKLSVPESDIEVADVVVAARGIAHCELERKTADLCAYENPLPYEQFIELEAFSNIVPSPQKMAVGRTRSHSIDVSYK